MVLAVYLLFSIACFFTVHEHWPRGTISITFQQVDDAPDTEAGSQCDNEGLQNFDCAVENRPAFGAARFQLSSFFIFC